MTAIEPEITRTERVQIAAMQVENLFMLASLLIPDLDLLEDVKEHAEKNLSFVTNGAVLIEALGKDSEASENEARLRSKRVNALVNLVETLKTTEDSRQEYLRHKKAKDESIAEISKQLGL